MNVNIRLENIREWTQGMHFKNKLCCFQEQVSCAVPVKKSTTNAVLTLR